MKWIIFTGTAAHTNDEVEHDVRKKTRQVLRKGWGIITGGAVGVDYFCMDEVYKQNKLENLRVILPVKLEQYARDYLLYKADVVKPELGKSVMKLMKAIKKKSPASIMEMKLKKVNLETLLERDTEEVKYGNEVYAFHVNKSIGTQDTIDKAKEMGVKIGFYKKYTLITKM